MVKEDLLIAGLIRAVFVVCLFAACLFAPPAGAQSKAPSATTAKELIRQAYVKTKDVKSPDELTEIVRMCAQAQRGELAPELKEYVQQLLAWTHNRRGEFYTQEAGTLTKSGQRERATKLDKQALSEFETAVKLNPNYWKAHHNRGVGYALAGKVDDAISDFNRAIELQPTYGNAWFNRGEVYYDRGKYTEAIRDYDEAIRLKPDDHEAYLRRGHTRFQLQQRSEALADYNRAVELAPDNAEAITIRGDAHRSLGQWSRADADYRRAIELEGNFAHAHQSAAWLMATCPEPDFRNEQLAVQYAQKALELLGQQDYQYLDTLAAAYANAGDFAKAKQQLQTAIKIAPPAQAAGLKSRLALYEKSNPYREGITASGRPTLRGSN